MIVHVLCDAYRSCGIDFLHTLYRSVSQRCDRELETTDSTGDKHVTANLHPARLVFSLSFPPSVYVFQATRRADLVLRLFRFFAHRHMDRHKCVGVVK